jgi:hypothetical protein
MSRREKLITFILLINLTACSQLELLGANLRKATNTPLANRSLPATFTPTASATAIPPIPATPVISADSQQSALLPDFAADADAFPNATRYDIEVDVNFPPGSAEAQIEGIARIRFVNPLEQNLSQIVLMLWPNDDQYQAHMQTGPALVEGQRALPKSLLDGKALRIDLRPALAPGESVDFSIPFSLEIGTIHELAPKRMGISEGVLIAPTFYPLIPRLVDGKWDTYAALPAGDTTNSEVAFYSVHITAPESLAVVATGVESASSAAPEGKQRIDFLSGPVRDFAFAIGPLVKTSRSSAGITLNAWTLPQHDSYAQTVLQAAGIQVELLSEILGPYPYRELDLVDAPFAFEGIAYPGLVFIGSMGTNQVTESTVREVAHQWFYGLLGNDQIREPWLDEATASFATVLYYERAYGLGQGTGYLSDIRAILRSHPDSTQPIGLNVAEYKNESDYHTLVHLKGALFLEALRNKMGSYRFNAFLSSLFTQYRYGMMKAEDFQDAAEATCACDLQNLFDLWVYEGGEVFPP